MRIGTRGIEMHMLPEWRRKLLDKHLLPVLILLELVLSMVFISVGYLSGDIYFRGVGVGLVIAWVTSTIALLIRSKARFM